MNITIRLLAGAFVLIGLICAPAYAGNTNRTGTAGAEELLIPVGANGIALGGSNVSMAQGVNALYWNPAGLAHGTFGTEALFSHMNYLAGIGIDYGALGVGFGKAGSFAVSFKSINFGNIPVTTADNPDGTGATYSPAFVTLGMSYSRVLTDRISVGANFKFLSEDIMSTTATGFAVDAGVEYHGLVWKGLSLGVVIKNLGPNMTFKGSNLYHQQAGVGTSGWYSNVAAPFELPSQMEVGLAYNKVFGKVNDVTLFGDFENNNYSSDLYKIGLQYAFNNLIFLRGGYNFAPNAGTDPTGATAFIFDYTLGAGLNYNLGAFNFTFDYAYEHVRYFSGINTFTVQLGF